MTGFSALPVTEEGEREDGSQLTGVSKILGPRWLQLPTLTIGLLGVQVLWSVEMSYASPYLLSLGLKKSLMAVVFLAGPLSGLIVQPVIGVLADNSKSRFGRRRPYMLSGVALCVFAVLLLGFTRQFAGIFTMSATTANDILTIWLAILSIYCIDFSVNAVQAVDRALLVDTLPTSEQASGNAWAARMLGIGSVAGFFVGNIDLTSIFPMLGKTELEVLSIITAVLLIITHSIMSYCVKEKVLVASTSQAEKGLVAEMKLLWDNMLKLPRVIRQICFIQFFAWLGWFPVLFYTTVYIGELYKRANPLPADADDGAIERWDAEATRLGTRAMLYSAVLSLVTNFLAPLFAYDEEAEKERNGNEWFEVKSPQACKVHLATLWAASHLLFACCMGATLFTSSVAGATILMSLTGFAWAITQWVPFSLLGEAIRSDTFTLSDDPDPDAASILLGDTRNRRSGDSPFRDRTSEERRFLVVGDEEEEEEEGVVSGRSSVSVEGGNGEVRVRAHESVLMQHPEARLSPSRPALREDTPLAGAKKVGGGDLSAKAGVILGIHNIFIVIPQFLVTGLSSIIFAIFEPTKSVLHGHHPGNTPPIGNVTLATPANNTLNELLFLRDEDGEVDQADGPNSVAIIFRLGGIAAAAAFVLCLRLSRELKRR
ncbi:hypothetical protein JAAARDRAFT_410743 [Jaapia argillacea MUCL 33604]|uniref:Major facilitator superfamily (MFS) profile domain-containing protein n=1 Tax=Jaapia argillacea MUCL 33604 TaxID=933084 RepID=A0A067PS05_9AGAM|nr:hypothetical protein JAAARDRAFT_410743 [Jaapia argillacea MUCL 33604]